MSTDWQKAVLELLRSSSRGYSATELKKWLTDEWKGVAVGADRHTINSWIYRMLNTGLVKKVGDSPPIWYAVKDGEAKSTNQGPVADPDTMAILKKGKRTLLVLDRQTSEQFSKVPVKPEVQILAYTDKEIAAEQKGLGIKRGESADSADVMLISDVSRTLALASTPIEVILATTNKLLVAFGPVITLTGAKCTIVSTEEQLRAALP